MLRLVPFVFIPIVGCQSAVVRIERAASGAIEGDIDFKPREGVDGHYVSFPSEPLTNCIDILQADSGQHEQLDQKFCATSQSVRSFVGYTAAYGQTHKVSWLSQAAADAEESARQVLATYGAASGPAPAVPVVSFYHFSDVQIREPQSKLGGSTVSHTLDPLVQSFERDYEQELYSGLVYAAAIRTANAELNVADPARPAPVAMFHTGDAVDSGLASEFERFRRYSDDLEVPWYQVVGNHDVLAFGNLSLHPDPNGSEAFTGDRCGDGVQHCTCTRLSDLVRELAIVDRPPDNCGGERDVDSSTAELPIVLQRVCIDYAVTNDRLVMNPEKFNNSINAFIAAHCDSNMPVGGDIPSQWAACKEAPQTLRVAERLATKVPEAVDVGAQAELPQYAHIPSRREKQPDLCATTDSPGRPSRMHGFDLISGKEGSDTSKSGPTFGAAKDEAGQMKLLSERPEAVAGYYCLQLHKRTSDTPAVWAVVLNTSTDVGAYGDVSEEQLGWLARVLDPVGNKQIAPDDLILTFAHHPLYDIFDPSVRKKLIHTLAQDDRMVGYFAGHLHSAQTRVIHDPFEHTCDHGAGHTYGHHFLEILAPALISWPQQLREVTVKKLGGVGYFEILSFSPHGDGTTADLVKRAQRGAERDKCNEDPKHCRSNVPIATSRESAFMRLFFRWPGSNAPGAKPPSTVEQTATSCSVPARRHAHD